MIRRDTILLSTALMLAGCGDQPTKVLYAAPPEVLALFAGQARGADFSLARACGADVKRVGALAAEEQAPTSLSPETAAIYKSALASRAGEAIEKPPLERCSALRKRSEFAALFPPPPPPSTKAERIAAAERRAKAAPAYCAEATESVLRDPTVTAGLRAIREKCNPGDTIALPAVAVGVIASACDLSKPLAVADPNVFCTLSRIRGIRTTR
jgi:hypothetical protein